MKLYIKNMVCNRCILVVKQELEKLKLIPEQVTMGEVDLKKAPTEKQLHQLGESMKTLGFELLDDQKKKKIEDVKNLLIKKVQSGEIEEHFRLSDYLQKKLNRDYSGTSRLFSEVEGMTIEQYFILQKIEKVKELLVYDEFNLNEISYNLGYSSTAHLAAQFKKTTGLTTGHFKKMGPLHRKSLDKVTRK